MCLDNLHKQTDLLMFKQIEKPDFFYWNNNKIFNFLVQFLLL
jgi:hypothetical protein